MLKSTPPPESELSTVEIGARGRFVVPASIREKMKLRTGQKVVLWLEADGSLRVAKFGDVFESVRGLYAHVAPGRRLSRELIAERRREAKRENRR